MKIRNKPTYTRDEIALLINAYESLDIMLFLSETGRGSEINPPRTERVESAYKAYCEEVPENIRKALGIDQRIEAFRRK